MKRRYVVLLALLLAAANVAVVLFRIWWSQPAPDSGQARLAERRRLLDQRAQELAAAVDAYAADGDARLDDLSRPAAEGLRGPAPRRSPPP
jgi:hypothetical protein